MRKILGILCSLILCAAMAFTFTACGGGTDKDPVDPGTTTGGNTGESGNTGNTGDSGNTGNTGDSGTSAVPTSAEVVSAIKTSVEDKVQNYDFTLNLAGNVSVGVIQSPNATANYNCNYRYNSDTGALSFKRVTSGILLYDSTEYIYSESGDSRVKIKMNDKNEVKKVVVNYEDDDINLINIPFTTLLGSLDAGEISDITGVSGNDYTAKLKLSANNIALNAICTVLGKLDTSIDLKGVTVTNPANGIDFSFTMANGKFTGYTMKASVTVPVKVADITLNLTYSQSNSTSPINLPSTEGVIVDSAQISSKLAQINAALTNIKDDDIYSLDFMAVNEMDPGATKFATKDWYESCLYKNTTAENRVDFNHSYCFHSHHDEDGKEAYKYAYGNIESGDVYLSSFKGSNTYNKVEGITADTQFDFLTKYFIHEANEVDCMSESVKDGKTTYTVYFKDSVVKKMSQDIVGLLNTNGEEGVVEVENYFNNENYNIKDAALIVTIEGQNISYELDTKIKYAPTEGEYTDNKVTLDNSLVLYVNKSINKAQDYEAPGKGDGTFTHVKYQSPAV